MAPRSRIFISYRRQDTEHAAGRLADDLRKAFPPDHVFLDIASIDPGADFVDALERSLADCAAVLVLIGPRWLTEMDEAGRRRIDSPDDWVHREVAASLQRPEVRVFPILLDTAMPDAQALPEDLAPLTRRQAFPLTSRHWANDVSRLINLLRKSTGATPASDRPAGATPPAPSGRARRSHGSALRWGTAGVALFVLTLAGVLAFRPSLLGLRTVVIRGPQPLYAPYKTGDVFQECEGCPQMVVIMPVVTPAGGGLRPSETPVLKPFAIGRHEVTRAQYFASAPTVRPGCWDATGDRGKTAVLDARTPGFAQTDDHPVVCVNIVDIRPYLAWLNARTRDGTGYRLPSDAEWFYAAAAGTGDVDPWGAERARACDHANVHDLAAAAAGLQASRATFDCNDGFAFTAPVGRYQANAWGLYDTIGNVAEFLQDCGSREPQQETCRFRAVAGGAYDETLTDERRFRIEQSEGDRKVSLGFRVARSL